MFRGNLSQWSCCKRNFNVFTIYLQLSNLIEPICSYSVLFDTALLVCVLIPTVNCFLVLCVILICFHYLLGTNSTRNVDFFSSSQLLFSEKDDRGSVSRRQQYVGCAWRRRRNKRGKCGLQFVVLSHFDCVRFPLPLLLQKTTRGDQMKHVLGFESWLRDINTLRMCQNWFTHDVESSLFTKFTPSLW